jgi:hypothetical protein
MATNEPVIGQLIEGEANRDAIHVAIAPVVAAEKLAPGQHVGFVEGSTDRVESLPGAVYASRRIGIVDPYLPSLVFPEQRFYLFLYPRTVTSLRHEWTHPAFQAVPTSQPQPSESENWLRNFADKAGLSYDRVLEIGRDYADNDGFYTEYDTSRARDAFYDVDSAEWWTHIERVTGITVNDKQHTPFNCSC